MRCSCQNCGAYMVQDEKGTRVHDSDEFACGTVNQQNACSPARVPGVVSQLGTAF